MKPPASQALRTRSVGASPHNASPPSLPPGAGTKGKPGQRPTALETASPALPLSLACAPARPPARPAHAFAPQHCSRRPHRGARPSADSPSASSAPAGKRPPGPALAEQLPQSPPLPPGGARRGWTWCSRSKGDRQRPRLPLRREGEEGQLRRQTRPAKGLPPRRGGVAATQDYQLRMRPLSDRGSFEGPKLMTIHKPSFATHSFYAL